MNSSSNGYNLRAALSAVLAAAIVGTSGLALDKAHLAAAPAGTIEVGELTPPSTSCRRLRHPGGHRQRPAWR